MSSRRYSIHGFLIGLLIPILLLSSGSIERTAQSLNLDLEEIDTYLQERIAEYHIPGMAIAIVKDDRIIFQKGYGEGLPGQPITPQTSLYIGSVTKSFTALAVMRLVEEGKLDLDAPVQKYLPWFQVEDPQASSQITVRHLLNHTSGLSDRGDPNANLYPATLFDQAILLKNVQPTAEVGSKFQYYNQNYRLLGLLIEEVSGVSYGQFLKKNIFDPLQMSNTFTDPADAPKLAQGYSQMFGFPAARTQPFHPSALPSGYIISSAEDMAHFMIAMLNNMQYGDQQILGSDRFLEPMFAPPPGVKSDYGMGWLVGNDQTLGKFYFISGALEYFHAEVLLIPEEKVGVVFLANQGGVIPLFFCYPYILRYGAKEILAGTAPKQSPFIWVTALMNMMLPFYLGVELFCFWRLPEWGKSIGKLKRNVRLLIIALVLIVPIIVLVGLPLAGSIVADGKQGWIDMYNLQPDLTAWLLAVILLFVVKGMAISVIIARQWYRDDKSETAIKI